MARKIKNAQDTWVTFDPSTLANSLVRAGADEAIVQKILSAIAEAPELRSTEDLYNLTYCYLKLLDRSLAARYSLKQALYQLGPRQEPFKQLIGKIYAEQDYTVREDHTLQGRCVEHTIPLIIEKNDTRSIVICILHERAVKAKLDEVLKLKALFDDLAGRWSTTDHPHLKADQALLITNATFSSKALEYAACENIALVGWNYPHENLQTMIDSLGLYPITCLTGLTKTQKIILVQKNIILCRELLTYREVLKKIQVPGELRSQVYEECNILSQPRSS